MALLVVFVRAAFRFIFGDLSADSFLLGLRDGLNLGVWVLAFGLLNLILDFGKLADKIPGSLGTALSIAVNLVPEQARSLQRVRWATLLRAHRKGIHLVRSVIAPVIRLAVDSSFEMAASLETRGFGKAGSTDFTGLKNLDFSYDGKSQVLTSLGISLQPGTLTLLSGPTGCGKSTALRLCTGLVPHFTGGVINQEIPKPNQLAGSIAFVDQNPSRSFVAATVYEEIAFGARRLGIDLEVVSEIARRLDLLEKLEIDPRTLSAGWQQRVAIAAALATKAKTVLLDEPFSLLDESARLSLFEILRDLKNSGSSIAIAEHRVDLLGGLVDFEIKLGEIERLEQHVIAAPNNSKTIRFEPVTVTYGKNKVLNNFKLSVPEGMVSVVSGANGSGKSSLLRALANQGAALVPQPASDLLFMNTVSEELKMADHDNGKESGSAQRLLDELCPGISTEQNPNDLSEGQKLALVIAIQLNQSKNILLLDEPTVGFDNRAKNGLAKLLLEITKRGKTVVLATHDFEFAGSISSFNVNLEASNARQ